MAKIVSNYMKNKKAIANKAGKFVQFFSKNSLQISFFCV